MKFVHQFQEEWANGRKCPPQSVDNENDALQSSHATGVRANSLIVHGDINTQNSTCSDNPCINFNRNMELKSLQWFNCTVPNSEATSLFCRQDELRSLESMIAEAMSRNCANQVHRNYFLIHGAEGTGKTELVWEYLKFHSQDFAKILWINSDTKDSLESSFLNTACQMNVIPHPLSTEMPMSMVIWKVYERISRLQLSSTEANAIIVFDNANGYKDSPKRGPGIFSYLPPLVHNTPKYPIVIVTTRNKGWMKWMDFTANPKILLGKLSTQACQQLIALRLSSIPDSDESWKALAKVCDFNIGKMKLVIGKIQKLADNYHCKKKRQKLELQYYLGKAGKPWEGSQHEVEEDSEESSECISSASRKSDLNTLDTSDENACTHLKNNTVAEGGESSFAVHSSQDITKSASVPSSSKSTKSQETEKNIEIIRQCCKISKFHAKYLHHDPNGPLSLLILNTLLFLEPGGVPEDVLLEMLEPSFIQAAPISTWTIVLEKLVDFRILEIQSGGVEIRIKNRKPNVSLATINLTTGEESLKIAVEDFSSRFHRTLHRLRDSHQHYNYYSYIMNASWVAENLKAYGHLPHTNLLLSDLGQLLLAYSPGSNHPSLGQSLRVLPYAQRPIFPPHYELHYPSIWESHKTVLNIPPTTSRRRCWFNLKLKKSSPPSTHHPVEEPWDICQVFDNAGQSSTSSGYDSSPSSRLPTTKILTTEEFSSLVQGENYDAIMTIYQSLLSSPQFRDMEPTNHNLLQLKSNMAKLHCIQGRNDQALQIFQQVLQARSSACCGSNQFQIFEDMYFVAVAMLAQKKYDEALSIFQKLHIELPRNHSRRRDCISLSIHFNIAYCLQCKGNYSAAQDAYRQLDMETSMFLCKNSNFRLAIKSNLAIIAMYQDQLQLALGLYQEVYEARKSSLGTDDKMTLSTWHDIAAILVRQGKFLQAREIIFQLLAIREKVLGMDHPDTIFSLNSKAVILYWEKNYNQALPICKEAYDRNVKLSGVNHSTTLIIKTNLEEILKKSGLRIRISSKLESWFC